MKKFINAVNSSSLKTKAEGYAALEKRILQGGKD